MSRLRNEYMWGISITWEILLILVLALTGRLTRYLTYFRPLCLPFPVSENNNSDHLETLPLQDHTTFKEKVLHQQGVINSCSLSYIDPCLRPFLSRTIPGP